MKWRVVGVLPVVLPFVACDCGLEEGPPPPCFDEVRNNYGAAPGCVVETPPVVPIGLWVNEPGEQWPHTISFSLHLDLVGVVEGIGVTAAYQSQKLLFLGDLEGAMFLDVHRTSGAPPFAVGVKLPSDTGIQFANGDEVRVTTYGGAGFEVPPVFEMELVHNGKRVLSIGSIKLPMNGMISRGCRTGPPGSCWSGSAGLAFPSGDQCIHVLPGQTAKIGGAIVSNHMSEFARDDWRAALQRRTEADVQCYPSFVASVVWPAQAIP